MKRFFGMMPSSEIILSKNFKDESGSNVAIQAGPKGWTIIWADSSSSYNDVCSTAEDNFDAAYQLAVNTVGKLTERQQDKNTN